MSTASLLNSMVDYKLKISHIRKLISIHRLLLITTLHDKMPLCCTLIQTINSYGTFSVLGFS